MVSIATGTAIVVELCLWKIKENVDMAGRRSVARHFSLGTGDTALPGGAGRGGCVNLT
jgi:hypothetical protein